MKTIKLLKMLCAVLVVALLMVALVACTNTDLDPSTGTDPETTVASTTDNSTPSGTIGEVTTAEPVTDAPGAEEDTRFGDLHVRPIPEQAE